MTLARHLVTTLLMLCACAAAQELPLPPHPRYVFQHMAEESGLGTITPVSLFQDHAGFIWIGTQSGLYRYDGADVTHFTTADGLPSEFIDEIEQAPDGTIWIGTRKGVAHFDGRKFNLLQLPIAGAEVGHVYQIFAIDQQNGVYIASDHGLIRVELGDPKHPQIWNSATGMPSDRIDAVYVGPDGVVWFASGHRVGRLDLNGNVALMPKAAGVPEDDVVCILADGTGALWLRTYNKLFRFDPGTDRFVEDDQNLPRANDFGMPTVDRGGNLVIPTVSGVFRKLNGRWVGVGEHEGMGVNAAFAVMEDDEGAYWVGLGGAGIERWPGARNWEGWTEADGLPDNVVWYMLRDREKRLWVGTNNGLAMWDGKSDKPRVWNEKNGLNGSTVRQMTLDKDGALWVLCYPGGLTRFDARTLQPQKIATPLPNPTSVRLTPDGTIWISNHAYLKAYDPAKRSFEDVPIPAGMVAATSHIEIAPDGTLWAGGPGGLVRYDGKQWLQFTHKDGLKGDVIAELAPISANEVWVRYDESLGIDRVQLKDGKALVSHFGAERGLHSDEVYLLATDKSGNVWAGSGQGLTRISPDLHFRRFTRADGLLSDDLSAAAFLADDDGTILFGTSGGLTRFDPRPGIPDVAAPNVVLLSAHLGGRDYLGSVPQVAHRDGTLQAHFAALTYRDPAGVRCRYRLNGLESQFEETTMHEVRYPALPTGRYTLEVVCRSAAGRESNIASFTFMVLPAWWEQWWARLSGIVVAILIVVLIIRLRTRALERERKRLEEAVANRSAELAAANVELKEASLTDPLTKVRNRRFFNIVIDSDVNQAVRAYAPGTSSKAIRNRDLIFYLVDIDHFKQVNDVYGHDAGDEMLVEIAKRISSVMRQSDVLIRWGGEEFLVVSRNAERTEAQLLAKRILDAIGGQPFVSRKHPRHSCTCSIGWAAFPWFVAMPGAVRHEEVLKLADRALYMAKDAGRNQAFGLMPTSADPIYLARPESGWKDLNSESERIPVQPLRTAGPVESKTAKREAGAT
jgi:diguanylate cyclase (GGDEF)-like protein